MKTIKISPTSKLLLVIGAIMLIVSNFVPIWRIELDAPQYPEGLVLLIYASKIAGAVDVINGLNHYIGMATLHSENFIEFTVLPYIISSFAIAFLAAAISGRRKVLHIVFISFVIFGIVAMVDFWRWEYDYGHNLDPNAAIIVPGMAYQPPLIGFKQLLNFGAYSIPDLGGWFFIGAGLLGLIAVLLENGMFKKFQKSSTIAASAVITMLFISSCSPKGPEPIKLNTDDCHFCKMTIADGRFGAEIITDKGKCYKFDDMRCLLGYKEENPNIQAAHEYVGNFTKSNELIDAHTAFFILSDEVKSPMRGDIAAFSNEMEAKEFAKKWETDIVYYTDLQKIQE